MDETNFNRWVYRFALTLTLSLLAVGSAWYADNAKRIPPVAAMDSKAPDDIFDPITGINRLHFPRAPGLELQARTHRIILALLGISATAGFLFCRRCTERPAALAWRCVIGALYLCGLITPAWLLIHYGRGTTAEFFAGAVFVALILFGTRILSRRIANRSIGIIACAMLGLWYGPGMIVRVDQSQIPWWNVELNERHQVAVVSYGGRLAQGLQLYDDVQPAYSGVLAIFHAALARCFGPLSARGDVICVEIVHVIYFVVAACCYFVFSGRRWILAASALVFAASTSCFATVIFHSAPNHTAWRTILFPVALASVIFSRRLRPRTRNLIWGAVATCGILQNMETGIAIAIGLGCLMLVSSIGRIGAFRVQSVMLASAEFAVGVLGAMSCYGLLCLTVLGYWCDFGAFAANALTSIRAMNQGASGAAFKTVDPLAAIVFGHAALVVLVTAMKFGHRAVLDLRAEARLFVATTILIWFAYYANRPDPEYLNSFYILYGVLLIDLLRAIADARFRRGPVREAALGAAFLLVITIVPQVMKNYQARGPEYRQGWKNIRTASPPLGAIEVSGVWLRDDRYSAALLTKGAFIRRQSQRGSITYFTENGYLVPKVSGIWSMSPLAEPMWECPDRESFDKFVRDLNDSRRQEIFFDAPETLSAGDAPVPQFNPALFNRYLKRALSNHFEFIETIEGWERWRRKAS